MSSREKIRPGRKLKKEKGKSRILLERITNKLKWIDPFTYTDIFLEKIGHKKNKLVAWPVEILVAFITAWLLYLIFGFLLGTKTPAVVVVSGSMIPTFYRGDIMVLQGATYNSLKAPEIIINENIAGKRIREYAVSYCSLSNSDELVECSKYFLQRCKSGIKTKKVCIINTGECVEIGKDGDIVVYFSDTLREPIIHRVVVKIKAKDGNFVLTKGDNANTNCFLDQDGGIASSAVPIELLDGKTVFMVPYLGYIKLLLMDDLPCVISNLIKSGKYDICTRYWPDGRLGFG
ncbi:MAG: hypothetical protein N3F05_02520 [Candidatus Diapherotrites archaeon]|nr:hypothetical protein [Candidatus Diapherotrites archaeon]